mgnify:CR=1 FL=1
MSKKKEVNSGDLVKVEPITDNQKRVFEAYKEGKNGFFFGCAGTGKTFITLYQSLQDVLFNIQSIYDYKRKNPKFVKWCH